MASTSRNVNLTGTFASETSVTAITFGVTGGTGGGETRATVRSMADDVVREQLEALGSFIREQRRQAQLSLRELAASAEISNPYLSQIERGLHQPSVRVLKSIAGALGLSVETLLARAGFLGEEDRSHVPDTTTAILTDPALTQDQRTSLLAVYRSYVATASR